MRARGRSPPASSTTCRTSESVAVPMMRQDLGRELRAEQRRARRRVRARRPRTAGARRCAKHDVDPLARAGTTRTEPTDAARRRGAGRQRDDVGRRRPRPRADRRAARAWTSPCAPVRSTIVPGRKNHRYVPSGVGRPTTTRSVSAARRCRPSCTKSRRAERVGADACRPASVTRRDSGAAPCRRRARRRAARRAGEASSRRRQLGHPRRGRVVARGRGVAPRAAARSTSGDARRVARRRGESGDPDLARSRGARHRDAHRLVAAQRQRLGRRDAAVSTTSRPSAGSTRRAAIRTAMVRRAVSAPRAATSS